MADYNDGNWHGWDGGECPVHPKTMIAVKWITREGCFGVDDERMACNYNWPTPCLFRVVKQPKPREFWVNEYEWGYSDLHDSKEEADGHSTEERIRCIHVREVIEE